MKNIISVLFVSTVILFTLGCSSTPTSTVGQSEKAAGSSQCDESLQKMKK